MKRILLTTVFVISVSLLFAQIKSDTILIRPFHNINLTIGEGSVYSINYERLYFINSAFFLTGQLGIGYNEEYLDDTDLSTPAKYVVLPHHFTGNIGKRRNFFEFGLSGLIVTSNVNNHYLSGLILGYRLQCLTSKKINFRIGLNIPFSILKDFPLMGYSYDPEITYLPFGLSIGYCFL